MWMCGGLAAVGLAAVDVGLSGEGQVTALGGLPEAQLTMAHLGDGIRGGAMGILCEQGDVCVRGRGTKGATHRER